VGKVKRFIRSHKIQQWRENPSPAPYSALSKGSKIPNLEVAAQAAARKTLTIFIFRKISDPDPDLHPDPESTNPDFQWQNSGRECYSSIKKSSKPKSSYSNSSYLPQLIS
jgi:hypothetical protein